MGIELFRICSRCNRRIDIRTETHYSAGNDFWCTDCHQIHRPIAPPVTQAEGERNMRLLDTAVVEWEIENQRGRRGRGKHNGEST